MSRALASICPFCGEEHERTTAVVKKGFAGAEPHMRPGDFTLCWFCGEFCVMGDSGMLRRPTHSEARQIRRDQCCVKLRDGWQTVQAAKARRH